MIKTLEDARDFAFKAHEGQKYGESPYSVHLLDVVYVAMEFKIDNLGEEYLKACYLHDVAEDTSVTVEEISQLFGSRVAELVSAVTCVKGLRRKDKFKEAYPRTRGTPGAVLIKLCDRIANVRNCIFTGSSLIDMYSREYAEFKAQLMDPEDTTQRPLWRELDRLISQ